MSIDQATEDLLRDTAPQVLAVLTRRYGDFAAAEDATQEALIAAARHWPADGVPGNPRGWLIQTGARKLLDQRRNEQSRRHREEIAAVRDLPGEPVQHDDTLTLLLLCCHPALTPASAIALTLRAAGGLTTAEIARAFLVPESTMAQRISRAKQRIKDTGAVFARDETRLPQVRHVLYLIFNEGYAASTGSAVHRADLSAEAIRLARMLPADPESIGLLALMLLTDARRPARTDATGGLVPLDEQDRTLWDRARITEGTTLLDSVIGTAPPGEYQIQAAIAALHDRAATTADTEWPHIQALYSMLDQTNPVVVLNGAIAAAMVHGPAHGLALIADLKLPGHRLAATRAHLYERAGDTARAIEHYREAAALTTSIAERDHLILRASRLRWPESR